LGVVVPDDAVDVATRILALIASRGASARVVDLLHSEGIDIFRTAAGPRMAVAILLPRRPCAEPIGLHRLSGGRCAIGVALAFGHASARDLVALAGLARATGATWARPAPGRTFFLGPIDEMSSLAVATAADDLGFVVDARD